MYKLLKSMHMQAWLENKDPKSMQSVYGSLWKEVIVQPDKMTYASRYVQDFGSMKAGLAAKPVYFRCCCLVLLLLKFLASKGGFSRRKCMNGDVHTDKQIK